MMPLVATGLAPMPLRLGALLFLVSVLSAVEASDLARISFHEDQHFCRSSMSWCEGQGLWGVVSVRDDGWVKHAPHLHMKGVIQTCPLNAVHAVNQVMLDNEILFLSVCYSLPGILENISQGLLDVSFASVTV